MTTNRCVVSCTADTQCAGTAGGFTPKCDTTTMRCVQCLSNTDCTNPRTPTCSMTTHFCM
jgi:hypothetical protein